MHFNLRTFAVEPAKQRELLLEHTKSGVDALGGLMRNRVLVATYVTPERTAGGIIRPDRNMDENRFQCKVGLVLAMGPEAFNFPDDHPSIIPSIGDWIFYYPSDARELGFGDQVLCRVIFDDSVVGIINDPERVW